MLSNFSCWKICLVQIDLFLYVCLFVKFDSLLPINNLSVIKGRVFLGWTSTKLGLMFLLKDTSQWRQSGSSPRPFSLESSTLSLSHCAPFPVSVHAGNLNSFLESRFIILCLCLKSHHQLRSYGDWTSQHQQVSSDKLLKPRLKPTTLGLLHQNGSRFVLASSLVFWYFLCRQWNCIRPYPNPGEQSGELTRLRSAVGIVSGNRC